MKEHCIQKQTQSNNGLQVNTMTNYQQKQSTPPWAYEFSVKIQNVTFTQFLMPVIRYNFRKT